MTDFRALCQKLMEELENAIRVVHHEDGTKHISAAYPVLNKTKAALARPTDEEILRIAAKIVEPYETSGIAVGEYEAETECTVEVYGSELISFAHAVLDRWGQDQQNKTRRQPMTDFRAICAELHAAFNTYAVDEAHHDLLVRTEAALAQPEPQGPSDKELLELMPESMRDEFSYAARVCSDVTGRRVKPGIFRVALNTAALEYAQAVLAKYGS